MIEYYHSLYNIYNNISYIHFKRCELIDYALCMQIIKYYFS